MGHAATCVCPPRHPPGPTTSPFGGSIPAWVVQTGGDSGVRRGWRVAGASFGCWLHPCPQGTGLGGGGVERMTVLRSGVTLSGCDGGYSQGVRRSRACRANRVSLGDPEETETGVSTGSEGGEQPHVFPPPTSPSSLRTTPGSGPSTHLLSRRSHGTLWSWETLKHRDGGGGVLPPCAPLLPPMGPPPILLQEEGSWGWSGCWLKWGCSPAFLGSPAGRGVRAPLAAPGTVRDGGLVLVSPMGSSPVSPVGHDLSLGGVSWWGRAPHRGTLGGTLLRASSRHPGGMNWPPPPPPELTRFPLGPTGPSMPRTPCGGDGC